MSATVLDMNLGEGILHYGVRRGCAPVLGSFWPENSEIGIYFSGKSLSLGYTFT